MVLRTSPLPLVPRDLVTTGAEPGPAEPDFDGEPTIDMTEMSPLPARFDRDADADGSAGAPATADEATVPR
jgi:hypothetical protein